VTAVLDVELPAEVDVSQHLVDAPGVYDLPEVAYHADPCRHTGGSASSTVLKHLIPPAVPALARHAQLHPEYRDVFDLGSVTHALTLGAGCPIVEVLADDWRTARAQAARLRARAAGQVALLSKDLDRARRMADAVLSDPDAAAILRRLPGAPERVLVWDEGTGDERVRCRALLDRWPAPDVQHVPIVGDLKTADDLDDEALTRSFWRLGYRVQRVHYGRGYRAVHGVDPQFVFVVVRKNPPHLVRLVELSDRAVRIAQDEHEQALDVWRRCTAADDWPGYAPGLLTLDPPRWVRTEGDYW
jgi:hypothetical protein